MHTLIVNCPYLASFHHLLTKETLVHLLWKHTFGDYAI
jgi:hypothetical protein